MLLNALQSICTDLLFPTVMHRNLNSPTNPPTVDSLTLIFASQMEEKYHFHLHFKKIQPQKHVIQV